MTFVFAKKFDRRIVILSDTMIADEAEGRANAIPGWLKAVVLNGKTSVGYAGNATRALDAIRSAKKSASAGGTLQETMEHLREATIGGPQDCDFLVVSHVDDARIHRIWEGRISGDVSEAWIGTDVKWRSRQAPNELECVSGFIDLFRREGTHVSGAVGGLPVELLGSPEGHCYVGQALATAWDPISLGSGATDAQMEDRRSGKTEWRYNVCDPVFRGVAILGLYVEQARMGFIYDPLNRDDALAYPSVSLEAFNQLVQEEASKAPGAFKIDRESW